MKNEDTIWVAWVYDENRSCITNNTSKTGP